MAAVGLVALAGWVVPSGSGEARPSPDGRFEARAFNMVRGTLMGGRDRYVEIGVVEVGSGREVWRVAHRPGPDAGVPDYGHWGERYVRWAADSSAVTVPVATGREITLAVR